MSYNKYNYANKNRLMEEEYSEKLDEIFEKEYGLDIDTTFIEWEE